MGLYKRGNIYYIEYFINGRKIKKAVSPQKRVAKAELERIKLLKRQGRYSFDDNSKLEVLIDAFKQYAKNKKTPHGYETDCLHIKNLSAIISPSMRLIELNGRVFEDYRQARIRKGVKASTINREFTTIKSMLNRGIEWGYLHENPARTIKPLPVPKNPPKFLSKDEIAAVLNVAKPRERDIFLFLINTGLRKSEFVNLKWENVSFSKGTLFVPGEETKSGTGRAIPMNKAVKDILSGMERKGRYVFLNSNGRQYSKWVLLKIFHRLYKKAKIDDKGYTIHTLRHTFASWLVMSGIGITTVKELLGHASLTTTLIYSHLSKEHLAKAVNVLNYSK